LNFEKNFNPEIGFEQRKTSIKSFIKTLDKQLKIFKEVIIIEQHIYNFILFKKIQDLLILEDQLAYRVF
jgi:hypothetical protein